jgi:hypothetical protein
VGTLERGTIVDVITRAWAEDYAFGVTRDNVRVKVELSALAVARFGVLLRAFGKLPAGISVVVLNATSGASQCVVPLWPFENTHMFVPINVIAPIASPFDGQTVAADSEREVVRATFNKLPLPIMSTLAPLRRIPHDDWIVAWPSTPIAEGTKLSLELVQVFSLSGAPESPTTVTLHSIPEVDLGVPFVTFKMPTTAAPDVFRRDNRTPKFVVRTMLVASLTRNGVVTVNKRLVARLRSVGGYDVRLVDALNQRVPPTVLYQPPLLATGSVARVSLRVTNLPLRPLETAQLEVTFTSNYADINDKVTFTAVKVELRQIESVALPRYASDTGIGTLLFSHTGSAVAATYTKNEVVGGGVVRVATLPIALPIPYLDNPISFEANTPAGKFAISHTLSVKLYSGPFSTKFELSTPVVLALPLCDNANVSAELPALPKDLQQWADRYVDLLGDGKLAAEVAAEVDNGAAAPAPAAAPRSRAKVVMRDAEDEDEDEEEEAAPEAQQNQPNIVRLDSTLDDSAEAALKKMKRAKCDVCGWKVTDGKLRRAHHGCENLAKHQETLTKYQRLERLACNVIVSVLDVDSNQTYKVEIAPLTTRNGLVWRIEEATGRRVRSLTVFGAPLPPDAKMADVQELDLEVELESAEASVKCEHCGTENEAGLVFCKNADDCGHLLPSRLVQTPYDSETMNLTECVICFEAFEAGARVTFLPCMHGFHSACAIDWLSRKTECPTCSSKVTKENLSME